MKDQNQGIVKRLLEKDTIFRRSYETHRDYETRLAKLEKKAHLSAADMVERNRLKKLKLALKDEMEKIISRLGKGPGQ